MKLLYATSIVYPSTLANRQQVRSMARAFAAQLEHSFTLGVIAAGEPEPGVEYLRMEGDRRSFMLAWRYVAHIARERYTHVFCREGRMFLFMVLYARLRLLRTTFVFELHDQPKGMLLSLALRVADGIVTVTNGMRDDVMRMLPAASVLVAPGAVDPARFAHAPDRAHARDLLAIAREETVIAYVGSLGFIAPWDYNPWKGADVLLDAARTLPEYRTYIVGGEPAEIAVLKERYPEASIVFMGQQDTETVTRMLRAADVLVLPNKSGFPVSERYTSPLKLFEYLASGTPVVASDLPSVRELLDEDECFFFAPNDPDALRSALKCALENPREAEARAQRARAKAHSWRDRAQSVLDFIQNVR